jgi:DNA-binding NarL/FixJ family response regulator
MGTTLPALRGAVNKRLAERVQDPTVRASGLAPMCRACLQCQHQSMARSVLIVDDHPGFRAQARVMLAAAGYDVVGEAADGESGVRVARELSPDVVLLDVQLPDITGFEVLRLVHGEPDPPAVVLISSRDASDYGRRVQRSGAQGFIPKAELSARTLAAVLGGPGR